MTVKSAKSATDGDPGRALSWVERNFEGHLADLRGYLKIDNLITNRERCDEVARRLKGEIDALGGRASILDYGDLPFVYGVLDAGAKRTLVLYRNYDIVPPEGADWSAPPYSGRVRRIEDLGDCIVARGAADPKGPLVLTLRAIEAWVKGAGRLPVNLIFLLEGDEQLGSPTLPKVIRERRAELEKAHGVLYPRLCQGRSGAPVLPLGVKGVLVLDLICAGGAWGGPIRTSIHSGNAAWVASPAWRMMRALGSLVDDQERVLVERFYDDVVQVLDEDPGTGSGPRLGGIEDHYEYLKGKHVLRFKHDLSPPALGRRYLGSPTFNLGNVLIHRTRPWSQFLLPCEVRAQIDIRLVPDQDPDVIVGLIRRHLNARGFPDIEVLTRLSYAPWSIDADHALVETVRRTYRSFGREPEVHTSSGTSHSFSLFDAIGLPLVVAGLGIGGRAFHSSEYAQIGGLREFEKSVVRFLHEFAAGGEG